MYSKQQILHAIISDGQKMMRDGEVENKKEFQNKLQLLAEQWQSVVRRANQKKAMIEASIKQWRDFNDLTEKLRDWLANKEYAMTAFDVDSVSLQKVKNILEKAQVCKQNRSFQWMCLLDSVYRYFFFYQIGVEVIFS